jgi:rod shape-determining protein MreC
MESLLYRYRNITVLLIVLFAQLVLLAWQVKSDKDVPLVRVWAVTAITPVASAIETVRNGTTGAFSNYFELRNAREQSRKLHSEVDQLRLENQLLKNELASARRVEAMAGFQAHTLSKMIGARVIGTTGGTGTKSVLIDRGTQSGVRKGMAVVTPDGIVGRVQAEYPTASQVVTVTDPAFAAGVESQKNHVHGVVKGLGNESAKVDYVPAGQKVEVGEMFYTSGEDRIFPKGLAVGKVTAVEPGGNFQDIFIQPTGVETAPEEVLVIVDPVHQEIPEAPAADTPVFLAPDVKPDKTEAKEVVPKSETTADQMMERYRKIGEAQNHQFGEGGPGTPPPNFNLKVPGVNAPAAPAGATQKAAGANGASAPPVVHPKPPAAATESRAKVPATTAPATTAPATTLPVPRPRPPAGQPSATQPKPEPIQP